MKSTFFPVKDAHLVIATHNGAHHADDVFGVCVLQGLFPNNTLLRTRDASLVAAADFAVDVGGEWDPSRNRFDHHQKGFAGARADGTVYASAGLVWAAYGVDFVQMHSPSLTLEQAASVAQRIDEELTIHIDRADTGAASGAPGLFGVSSMLAQFNSTWQEEIGLSPEALSELKLRNFQNAVSHLLQLLVRIVHQMSADIVGAASVLEAPRVMDGRVLVLAESGLNWAPEVCKNMPQVLFVVYPDSSDQQYQVRTVPVQPESFKARLDLPRSWAGLRDSALAAVSTVPDAVFCHNGCFIAGAVSKEGALRMAELALDAAGIS